MTFGERLKELRLEAGLSQVQLAAKVEVYEQHIIFWEKGQRPCNNVSKLKALADLFGVTTDYLLGRTDKRN